MTYAKGFWVPPSARISEAEERELGCYLCNRTWPFRQRGAYQAHFRQCVSDHRDEIEQARRNRTLDGLLEPWDPEVAEHMEKVGQRMRREGRLEVKPSERAGF